MPLATPVVSSSPIWQLGADELVLREGDPVQAEEALVQEFPLTTWRALGMTVSRTPDTPAGLWTLECGRHSGVARLQSPSGYAPQVRVVPKLESADLFFLADNAWSHNRDLLEQSRLQANLDALRTDPVACLLGWFLGDLGSFVRRAIRHDYVRREEVLHGRIRGRMLLSDYARRQLPRAQAHRIPCQYFDFTRDNLPNQILRASLLRVSHLIPEVRVPEARQALRAQVASISPHLHSVTQREVRDEDFVGLTLQGPLRHYRPILAKCRAILGRSFLSTDLGPHAQSAFLWDMSILFQEAVRGLLARCPGIALDRRRGRAELRTAGGDVAGRSPVDPDYVVRSGSSTAILDAKYKDIYANQEAVGSGLSAEVVPSQSLTIRRQDVYQLIAYGRHDRHPTEKLALVYPVTLAAGEPLPEPLRLTGFAEEVKALFVDIGEHGAGNAAAFTAQVADLLA